jgi:hypothetical protein
MGNRLCISIIHNSVIYSPSKLRPVTPIPQSPLINLNGATRSKNGIFDLHLISLGSVPRTLQRVPKKFLSDTQLPATEQIIQLPDSKYMIWKNKNKISLRLK